MKFSSIPSSFFLFGLTICLIFSCGKSPDPHSAPAISGITITSLLPSHGPFDTIDTVYGAGFDKLPSLDSITINGKKLNVISRTPNQIIVQIPSLVGTGNVNIWYQGKLIEGPVFKYDSLMMVTTIAGTSTPAEIDGNGLNAGFYFPVGIAIDHSGNIYVADNGGSCIRKIDTARNVTTLAGPSNLQEGFADGTGAAAMFSGPFGLCIDQSGNLYVADQFNSKIRKVSPTGVVTTFAGATYDSSPNSGGKDGPGTVATFFIPMGVACDNNGNIYVADQLNNKIRKITSDGTVSSFAGGDYYHFGTLDGQASSALFYVPSSVAVDLNGNVYVVDDEKMIIRKITPDGIVSTIVGFNEPGLPELNDVFHTQAIVTDKSGNLFFSVYGGVFERTPEGKIIRYAAGGIGETDGPIPIAAFQQIGGIAIADNGDLFVTDDNRVRKIGWQ